jgi:hypothetical protein
MFGRYELSLWRRVVGMLLVVAFIWGFYGYMTENHWPRGNGGNSVDCGSFASIPPECGVPFDSAVP